MDLKTLVKEGVLVRGVVLMHDLVMNPMNEGRRILIKNNLL